MTFLRPSTVALSAVLTCLLASVSAFAQGSNDDNPLAPKPTYARVGGEIGLSSIWQTGTYSTFCGDFSKGARLNPIIALAYDYQFIPSMRFELLAGFQGFSLSSSYNTRELEVVQIQRKNEPATVARTYVDFENDGTASFSTIFAMPSLKIYPARWLYVGGGIDLSLLMGGKTQYTKIISSKVKDVEGYGSTEIAYQDEPDPYTKIYPEQQLPGVNSIMMSAVGYVGAEFPVNRRLKIGPRLMYQLPLTSAVKDPDLKLNAFSLLIGARFDL